MTCCRSHRNNVTPVVVHHCWQKSSGCLERVLEQEEEVGRGKEEANSNFLEVFNISLNYVQLRDPIMCSSMTKPTPSAGGCMAPSS